jgi:DNA ligase (NAD+)
VTGVQTCALPISLDRFIYALGIRHIGEHIAKILAAQFGSIEKLIAADSADLKAIHEIGPEIAESIVQFFHESKNKKVMEKFHNAGVIPRQKTVETTGGQLHGKSFVFTGTLTSMSRAEAKAAVENLGGSLHSTVTAKTSYLVAGTDPGSKLDKAKAAGLEVISEEAFLKLIGR